MSEPNSLNYIDITIEEGGHWFSVVLGKTELRKLFIEGEYRGLKVCAVKNVFHPAGAFEELVYDFILARKGINPWRVINYTTGVTE
jgi:hypothetical protein